MQKNLKKHKITIVAPTPFYYHVPLYRRLSESSEIDLIVLYCSDETLRGVEVEKMYHTKGEFGTKENLLDGYKYKFLKNYSRKPTYLTWPFGLMNFGVCKELVTGKYELVVLQSWTNVTWWLAFLTCLFFRIPVVFMTDENILAREYKTLKNRLIKKFIIGKFVFRFSSGFFTAGSANENLYRYFGVPEKKLVRMYFSWGYEQFLENSHQLKSKRRSIRVSLGIRDEDFVITYMGRMANEKNLYRLLDAYSSFSRANKKLFFIGRGYLYENIEKYVKENNIQQVNLMGFQNRKKILDFYAASDLFILPSVYEPWGIVINEAMCFGLPIIASDKVGAATDLVKNGYNGFIFPSTDEKKLKEYIQKIADMTEKERQAMGENSLKIIRSWVSAIDPAKQIKKMLAVINRKNKR